MSVCSHSEKPYIEWDSSSWRESMGQTLNFLGSGMQEVYESQCHQADGQVAPWALSDSFPWECSAVLNKSKAYAAVPSTMKYLIDDNLLLSLVKQWH